MSKVTGNVGKEKDIGNENSNWCYIDLDYVHGFTGIPALQPPNR